MFKALSPVTYFKRIRSLRREYLGSQIFNEVIPKVEADPLFNRYLSRVEKGSMFVGINLLPEIKLQKINKLELQNEEKRRLAIEVSKFNEVFAKHGILEMVRMMPEKVDDDDYYGFMVEIFYHYRKTNFKSYSYITFYSLFLLGFVATAAYFLIGSLM